MTETTQKPRAYMRRRAYDGIDVMRLKKADRPRGRDNTKNGGCT